MGESLALLAGKAIESSEGLEDKCIERNADSGSLACEISGKFEFLEDSVGTAPVIYVD